MIEIKKLLEINSLYFIALLIIQKFNAILIPDNNVITVIKFLCSDWIIISDAFTGVSNNDDVIFQKSMFGIFDRKKALHFLQV